MTLRSFLSSFPIFTSLNTSSNMSDSEDCSNSSSNNNELQLSTRSLPTATPQSMKHPKKLWNLHRKTWSRDDLRTNIDQYLKFVAIDQPQCKNVLRGGSILLQCSCLATNLNNDVVRARVTDYLMTFLFQTTRKEQTLILTQRIRHSKKLVGNISGTDTAHSHANNADKEHCRFALPGEEDVMICSSALLTLLGFSRHVWAHCLKCADDCKHVDDKIMPQHGARRSNSGNALDESIAAALETFFENQIKQSEVSLNGNETLYILRTATTKKGLYELLCHEQGWELIKSAEGNIKPEPRMNKVQKPICSLSSFLAYWKKNYMQLDIPFSRRANDSLASPEQQSQNQYSPFGKKKNTTATPITTNGGLSVERRSFAETTNLIGSPRTLWATTTTSANTADPQNVTKKTYDNDGSEQLITDPNILQSRNQSLQQELNRCQDELANEKEKIQHLNTWLQRKESDVENEKEKNRRLSSSLEKKEYVIERLEAENKHLQAAIALFRVNLPSTANEPTVSKKSLKRKSAYASFASHAEGANYIESRDENHDETEERRTDIEAFKVKRLRI